MTDTYPQHLRIFCPLFGHPLRVEHRFSAWGNNFRHLHCWCNKSAKVQTAL